MPPRQVVMIDGPLDGEEVRFATPRLRVHMKTETLSGVHPVATYERRGDRYHYTGTVDPKTLQPSPPQTTSFATAVPAEYAAAAASYDDRPLRRWRLRPDPRR